MGDEDTEKERGMVGGRTNYGGSLTGIPAEKSVPAIDNVHQEELNGAGNPATPAGGCN